MASQLSGWGTPTEIDADEIGEALWADVAEDEDGNAMAVWQQSDTTCSSIWGNRYVTGVGWTDPVQISGDSLENAYEPDIDMDKNGNAIAVWWQGTVYGSIIFSNRYVSGTGWGTPTEVNVGSSGFAGYPSVVCDSSGNAFVAWIQYSSIVSSRYLIGQGWEPPEMVSANSYNAQPPSIGVDGVGNAVVVWSDKSSTTYNIWANRYVLGKGWGMQTLIENDDTGDCQSPRVAVDGAGNAIAVWHLMELPLFGAVHVVANRYIADVGWGSATLLETNATNQAWNPRIAMDGAGNAIAVWYEIGGSSWDGVWANMFSITTAAWSNAEKIPGTTGAEVDLAVNQAGVGIVVWKYGAIYSNIYRPQTGWEQPEIVADIPDVGTQDPMVSINERGDAVAVWMLYEGEQCSIWANDYTGQEPPSPVSITASVDFKPDTLNLRNMGKWIVAYIELPSGYDVGDILIESVKLNGRLAATGPYELVDFDKDKIQELMVKFDWRKVLRISEVAEKETMTMTVSGVLNNGTAFQGSDDITIIPSTHGSSVLSYVTGGIGAVSASTIAIAAGIVLLAALFMRCRRATRPLSRP
ncbi:hypothetical protein IMZ48_34435 [Candidatus Bathyarchaeota archaeon]|nr:hypothetical protein [Candidatus Bathyarchaeota archaeon]